MNKSLKIDFQEFTEHRNLYAADSINNLNKLKLCTNDRQDVLLEESEEGNHSDGCEQSSRNHTRNKSFLTLLIITVAVTIILSSCIIYLLVQMRYLAAEVTRKLEKTEKDIQELVKFSNSQFLLNQTRI
ncbi:leucine-rich single-pass membrane protein 1 [Pelodytes ibericus]